jgi:hypothetical protein
MPALIVLFVYRRPDHLTRTLSALRENPEARDSVLFVFSDGPKDEAASRGVARVQQLLSELRDFREHEAGPP